jgi:putative flippase GtrA
VTRGLAVRWLKFNAVGVAGFVVQLATLGALVSGLGVHYLIATGLAVEAAILHNFLWHQRYTWGDRGTTRSVVLFLRFNLTTGAVSILGNLGLMRLLSGTLRLNYLLANVVAIGVLSGANFAASHLWVFRAQKSKG